MQNTCTTPEYTDIYTQIVTHDLDTQNNIIQHTQHMQTTTYLLVQRLYERTT